MKNILKTALIASVSLNLIGPASAHDEWTGARPDGHAPIGVMADHYHKKGEWMTSYRYMFMSMDGNRMGDDNLSTAQVAPGTGVGFPIVPIKMHMGMHMLGMMYAPSDRVTLMGMLNHTSMEMDHLDPGLMISSSSRSKASALTPSLPAVASSTKGESFGWMVPAWASSVSWFAAAPHCSESRSGSSSRWVMRHLPPRIHRLEPGVRSA
jgi:hypothetical protein